MTMWKEDFEEVLNVIAAKDVVMPDDSDFSETETIQEIENGAFTKYATGQL